MRVRSETRALRWAAQIREWQTFGTSANVPVNYSRFIRASRRRVFLSTDSSQSAGGRATSEGVDCSTLFPDPSSWLVCEAAYAACALFLYTKEG